MTEQSLQNLPYKYINTLNMHTKSTNIDLLTLKKSNFLKHCATHDFNTIHKF